MPLLKTFYKHIFVFTGGIVFLFIPLLRDFHIESATIAGAVGSIYAAFSILGNKNGRDFQKTIRIIGYAYIFGAPMFIYSLFTGCLSVDGILFWIFTPLPAILFGSALGRLVRLWNLKYSRLLLLGILLLFGAGTLLFELKLYPQVYFFNHIWGYFPGPIYDEVIHFPKSYFYFRLLTLFWVFLLWFWPKSGHKKVNQVAVGTTAALMILFYANSANLGFISPNDYLQSQLKNHISTTHFDIYYPDNQFKPLEIEYWAQKHEFYFLEITNRLEVEWPEGRKIDSYIYAHPWQKKELVGAKYTSYVPIWLEKDQTHIAKQHLDGVLKHELVHIIAKQFGNRLFNGSNNIGLIEGLAEAVVADRSYTVTLDEILAAKPSYPSAEEMRKSLSNAGFYSGASSISYSTAGSFIGYLLDNYPVQNFKNTYPTANFDENYPISFQELVNQWHLHLSAIKVDSVASKISGNIMSQQSVFEKSCPHSLTRELQLWDSYNHFLADKDTLAALETIDKLADYYPERTLFKTQWLSLYLKTGLYDETVHFRDDEESSIELRLLKSDALYLSGNKKVADELLNNLKSEIDAFPSTNYSRSHQIRTNHVDYEAFLALRYKNKYPIMDIFKDLSPALKEMTLLQAIEQGEYKILNLYFPLITDLEWESFGFNQKLEILDKLIFLHSFGHAETLLNHIYTQDLRARFRERIIEQQNWFDFAKQSEKQ